MAQNAELPPGSTLGPDRHTHLVPNVFRALYDPVLDEPVPAGLIEAALAELDRYSSDAPSRSDGPAADNAVGASART